jgi:hypothetical protein
MDSIRDKTKDAIRGTLADFYHAPEADIDADLVEDMADAIFDALSIPDSKQDKEKL